VSADLPSRVRVYACASHEASQARAAPVSLLRPALKPGDRLVCYCPPDRCQAPAGFRGPCNRATTAVPAKLSTPRGSMGDEIEAPRFTDAERYAFVRKLGPAAFADLWAANIRGEGPFDALVDAGIAAERAA
jgi:hypothetical protein